MDKNEGNANDSIEEPFNNGYCRDVTMILTKNASERSTINKVTEELERQRLGMEHANIDKKISEILKRIETSQQEVQDLDRQLYKATELKNHAMTCFERTGEMINVLKEAGEKVKTQSKKAEVRRLEINKKVEELTSQKSKMEQSKKLIERLELDIKNISESAEPQLDQALVSENKSLKNKLQEARESLQVKQLKKDKIDNIRKEKLNIFLQINTKQEENQTFEKELGKKRAFLKDLEHKKRNKLNTYQERISNSTDTLKQLQKTLHNHIQNNNNTLKNIEEVKKQVAEKEGTLEDLKKKIQARQTYIKKENDKKDEERECEKAKLALAERKLQDNIIECERHRKVLSEKFDHLSNLKDHKGNLIIKLCDGKNKLVIQQQQNAEQQSKVDILSNKLEAEMRQLEEAKVRKLQLDEKLEQLTKQSEQLPLEQAEARKKIAWHQKEKIEELLKQQNFQKATVEFLQLRLDGELKKIDQLQKEIEEYDDNIKWDQMKYEMRKKKTEKLQEMAAKEQALYDNLNAELKKKEEGKKQGQKPPELEQEICLIEDEGKTSQSGRKSPGILKSPFKTPNANVPSNKRVTFQGLSSAESSSVRSLEERTDEDDVFNELLRNWTDANSATSSRKKSLDF